MPKTSMEQLQEHQYRSCYNEEKLPKTAAQCSREYRARQKALKVAAQQYMMGLGSSTSIDAPLLKRHRMKSVESDKIDGNAQVEIAQPNSTQICRTCLDRMPSDTCKSIFMYNIRSVVTMISNVELIEGDGLPPNICDKCFKQLEAVTQFKKRIESSDAALRMPSIESIKVEQDCVTQEQSIPTDVEQNVRIKEEPAIENEDELNYEPAILTPIKREEEEAYSENLDIDISSVKIEYDDDPLKLTEKEQDVSVKFVSNSVNEESEYVKFKKKQKVSQNFDTNITKNNGDDDGNFEEDKRISEKFDSNYIQGEHDNDTEDNNDSHLVDVFNESKKKMSSS